MSARRCGRPRWWPAPRPSCSFPLRCRHCWPRRPARWLRPPTPVLAVVAAGVALALFALAGARLAAFPKEPRPPPIAQALGWFADELPDQPTIVVDDALWPGLVRLRLDLAR